jgi:GAF domain-containing protein
VISFFRSLFPQNSPPHIEKQGDLTVLRERIFQGIMLIIACFLIVAFVILVSEYLIAQEWMRALIITLGTALVMAYTLTRRVPFKLRATVLVILLVASGVITYYSAGTFSNAKIYLVGAAVLASVFLGLLPGLGTLILGLGITLYFTIGKIPDVISDSVFYILIGSLATVSVALLVNNLQSSLRKQRELTQDLEYERLNMQGRVDQSTSSLERMLIQIRTASEIARAISSTLDPQLLLQQVVDLIQNRFGLYYVGLFLVDPTKKYAVLRAGTGQAGKDMIAENYRLAIAESSMIGWSIIYHKPRIAQDVGQETIRFKNPHLPLTRSEMALPFISRGTSLGSVSVQSTAPNDFDENDILILQSIVDSLSVAFENARLFDQSREDLNEIRSLNREYLQKSWAEVGEMYGDIQYEYQNIPDARQGSTNNEPTSEAHMIDLPITLRDQVIGQISIETDTGVYNQAQLEFVEAIALQTALALDNARLIEKTQRGAMQEQALSQISAQFSQALSVEEILKTAVREIGRLPEVNEVSVHLVSTDNPLPMETTNEERTENPPQKYPFNMIPDTPSKKRVRGKGTSPDGKGK